MASSEGEDSGIDLAAEGLSSDSDPPETLGEQIVRKTGWKRCESDPEQDVSARPMLGAATHLPKEMLALLPFILFIFDQTVTSSCVGQAIGNAIEIRLRALGMALVETVSRMAIYTWARMREERNRALHDDGCNPRDAILSIGSDGVPKEHDWPFDPKHINDALPWDVEQQASAGRIDAHYWIDSDDIARVHDIMNALVQLYPVVFGTFVDTAYMNLTEAQALAGVTKMNLADARGGDHMQCIVGYRTNADGSVSFLVLNSWGSGWGWNGCAWVHQDVIMSKASGNFAVMQVSQ